VPERLQRIDRYRVRVVLAGVHAAEDHGDPVALGADHVMQLQPNGRVAKAVQLAIEFLVGQHPAVFEVSAEAAVATFVDVEQDLFGVHSPLFLTPTSSRAALP